MAQDSAIDSSYAVRRSRSHQAAVGELVGMTKSYVATQYAINVASDRYAAGLSRSYVVLAGESDPHDGDQGSDPRTPGVILRTFPPAAPHGPDSSSSTAAKMGNSRARHLGSGALVKFRVRFPRITSGHKCQWLEDVIEIMPRSVVQQVVEHALVHDSVAKLNLHHLAESSPRLFWGIVTNTSGSTEGALQEIFPEGNYFGVNKRQTKLSEKAKDNELARKRARIESAEHGDELVDLVSDDDGIEGITESRSNVSPISP